jgi:hypothetical protein
MEKETRGPFAACATCKEEIEFGVFFCPQCGGAQLASMLLPGSQSKKSSTTANYDPLAPDYKPWRENDHMLNKPHPKIPDQIGSIGNHNLQPVAHVPWRPTMSQYIHGIDDNKKKRQLEGIKRKELLLKGSSRKLLSSGNGNGNGNGNNKLRSLSLTTAGSTSNDAKATDTESNGNGNDSVIDLDSLPPGHNGAVVYFKQHAFQRRNMRRKPQIPKQYSDMIKKQKEEEEEISNLTYIKGEQTFVYGIAAYEADWLIDDGYTIHISLIERSHELKDDYITRYFLRIGVCYEKQIPVPNLKSISNDNDFDKDGEPASDTEVISSDLMVLDVLQNDIGHLLTSSKQYWVDLNLIKPDEYYMSKFLQDSLEYIAKRIHFTPSFTIINMIDQICLVEAVYNDNFLQSKEKDNNNNNDKIQNENENDITSNLILTPTMAVITEQDVSLFKRRHKRAINKKKLENKWNANKVKVQSRVPSAERCLYVNADANTVTIADAKINTDHNENTEFESKLSSKESKDYFNISENNKKLLKIELEMDTKVEVDVDDDVDKNLPPLTPGRSSLTSRRVNALTGKLDIVDKKDEKNEQTKISISTSAYSSRPSTATVTSIGEKSLKKNRSTSVALGPKGKEMSLILDKTITQCSCRIYIGPKYENNCVLCIARLSIRYPDAEELLYNPLPNRKTGDNTILYQDINATQIIIHIIPLYSSVYIAPKIITYDVATLQILLNSGINGINGISGISGISGIDDVPNVENVPGTGNNTSNSAGTTSPKKMVDPNTITTTSITVTNRNHIDVDKLLKDGFQSMNRLLQSMIKLLHFTKNINVNAISGISEISYKLCMTGVATIPFEKKKSASGSGLNDDNYDSDSDSEEVAGKATTDVIYEVSQALIDELAIHELNFALKQAYNEKVAREIEEETKRNLELFSCIKIQKILRGQKIRNSNILNNKRIERKKLKAKALDSAIKIQCKIRIYLSIIKVNTLRTKNKRLLLEENMSNKWIKNLGLHLEIETNDNVAINNADKERLASEALYESITKQIHMYKNDNKNKKKMLSASVDGDVDGDDDDELARQVSPNKDAIDAWRAAYETRSNSASASRNVTGTSTSSTTTTTTTEDIKTITSPSGTKTFALPKYDRCYCHNHLTCHYKTELKDTPISIYGLFNLGNICEYCIHGEKAVLKTIYTNPISMEYVNDIARYNHITQSPAGEWVLILTVVELPDDDDDDNNCNNNCNNNNNNGGGDDRNWNDKPTADELEKLTHTTCKLYISSCDLEEIAANLNHEKTMMTLHHNEDEDDNGNDDGDGNYKKYDNEDAAGVAVALAEKEEELIQMRKDKEAEILSSNRFPNLLKGELHTSAVSNDTNKELWKLEELKQLEWEEKQNKRLNITSEDINKNNNYYDNLNLNLNEDEINKKDSLKNLHHIILNNELKNELFRRICAGISISWRYDGALEAIFDVNLVMEMYEVFYDEDGDLVVGI